MERYKISIITDHGMFCYFISGWYCKPTILEALCYYEYMHCKEMNFIMHNFVCQRYPKKRLMPVFHKDFEICALAEISFINDDRKLIVPVFK